MKVVRIMAAILVAAGFFFGMWIGWKAAAAMDRDGILRKLSDRNADGYRWIDFGYTENGSNVVLWTTQHPLR